MDTNEELVAVRTANEPEEQEEQDLEEPVEEQDTPEEPEPEQNWDREKAEAHFQKVHQQTMDRLRVEHPEVYAELKGQPAPKTQHEADEQERYISELTLADFNRILDHRDQQRAIQSERVQARQALSQAAEQYNLTPEQQAQAFAAVEQLMPQSNMLLSQPGGASTVARLVAREMRDIAMQNQIGQRTAREVSKETEKVRKAALTAQPEQVAPASEGKKPKRMRFIDELNASKPKSARDLLGT